jgi:hypothetical protein
MEYDHDDLITDNCLEEVVKAAERCPKVSFIYSDDVTVNWDGTSHCFSKEYGWEHYVWAYKGKTYHVNKQPDPNPKSLSEILWSPDHVRVWTREAYLLVGGHDEKLPVCDDHDVMIRTYLAGAHFEHIKVPLYIHRLRKDNTCTTRVGEIQARSRMHRNLHLHALVHEWCRRMDLPKYDLGGAHNCPEGYTPIDIHVNDQTGLALDVLSPEFDAAIPDDSVGCFRAQDFLEHIPIGKVPALLNVLYRKLVPGGWLLTNTPAAADVEGKVGRGAFQDPTHVSFWTENNWWYFTDRAYARFVPEITCRFQPTVLVNYYPSDWHKKNFIPYVRCDLSALKDGNSWWPGQKKI